MKQIKNEKELIKKLEEDIKTCKKRKIIFFSGHFPLVYSHKNIEALDYWGKFSIYTLELACRIGQYAKKLHRDVEFVFFVDDHMYEDWNNLKPAQIKTARRNLYRLRSGTKARLPKQYSAIMKKFGFDGNNVLRHDHGRPGRKDCLYFSEKILRSSNKKIENPCAREYTEFIENPKYFNKRNSYLISFIPNRCRENICDIALDKEIKNFNASHIFMETMGGAGITRKDLFKTGRGVLYRKD